MLSPYECSTDLVLLNCPFKSDMYPIDNQSHESSYSSLPAMNQAKRKQSMIPSNGFGLALFEESPDFWFLPR